MNKPPSKSRRANGTVKALAEALDITNRQVSTLLRQGMPEDVSAALDWKASQTNRDTSDELRSAKIRVLHEQEQRLKLQNEASRNELISRAEVHEMFVALGSAINVFCERASREIPNEVLGLSIEKSLPKSRAKMRELQNLFCDRRSEFWTKHPTQSDEPKADKPKRKKP